MRHMQRAPSFWNWRSKRFLLRLGLAYAVVPASGPLLMMLQVLLSGRRLAFVNWLGILLLYTIFSFAAMVVLGLPLLFLYSRLRWTSFTSFIAGGAVCAALTYSLVTRGEVHAQEFVVFAGIGIVEGLVLRLILFGVNLRSLRGTLVNAPSNQ
jgi:hypothetical protein